MQARLDGRLVLLYTLLVLQVLIVVIYVSSTQPPEIAPAATKSSVTFVKIGIPPVKRTPHSTNTSQLRFKTIKNEVFLDDVPTSKFFKKYNSTSCWQGGVDLRQMSSSTLPEKCICNQGWHGSDCGQPEVVWRAIMASKQNIKLERRSKARRIIHVVSLNDYNSAIAEVIVEELYRVVDLFVICDYSSAEDNFKHKLGKGLLQSLQEKILYVNVASKIREPVRVTSKFIWEKVDGVVRNLREDDIYVTVDPEQILNARALMFLKVYDGWPQPIGFRLRWSVYGFFWQHPLKTSISFGACNIGLLREAHHTNSILLPKDTDEIGERDVLGLVIGDLNHYGGWYCYLCQDPSNVIISLRDKRELTRTNVKKNVDVGYVEDLIGTGVWLDGTTNLLRAYRSREPYFAPEVVLNNTWKYDWLVENFYAKLDYY